MISERVKGSNYCDAFIKTIHNILLIDVPELNLKVDISQTFLIWDLGRGSDPFPQSGHGCEIGTRTLYLKFSLPALAPSPCIKNCNFTRISPHREYQIQIHWWSDFDFKSYTLRLQNSGKYCLLTYFLTLSPKRGICYTFRKINITI